jgi:molybdopterin/thiamine biosynthesis adenylyltransferase
MDYLRQTGILDPEEIVHPVTLIGAGGIGSFAALVLAKMGINEMTIFDPDVVEPHNIPNQLFRKSDVDKPKVSALKEIISLFADTSVIARQEMFSAPDGLKGIVISGVDSMKSRYDIWKALIGPKRRASLYIDARLGGEVVQIFAVRPNFPSERKIYESSLFPDSMAEELPCTAKNIIYNGAAVAALIASTVKKWIRQEDYFTQVSMCLKTYGVEIGNEVLGKEA